MIFEPLAVRGKTMPNRFFAQAMEGNDGVNGGRPSERTIRRYTELAKGAWGAVQIEATSVTETSLARINGMIINKKNLDSFRRLVDAFRKQNGKSLLFLQITHSGERSGPFSEIVALTPQSAERKNAAYSGAEARCLSTGEIEKIRDLFIEGALLAEKAGVDGIDFKMCHGYFGGEMLRPSNTRNDKWGGSFENRTRFLRETAEGIRASLASRDFIIGARISMFEGIRGGCGTADTDEIIEDISGMLDVVRVIGKLDMDFINISAGIPVLTGAITRPTETSKYLALHHLRYARAVRETVKEENLNLAVIGSAYSTYREEAPQVMEEMLVKGYVDACGFGRQIFADPLTVTKLENGEKPAWCLLCSGCSKLMAAQQNDGCIVYNDYYREINRTFKGHK